MEDDFFECNGVVLNVHGSLVNDLYCRKENNRQREHYPCYIPLLNKGINGEDQQQPGTY